MMIVLILEAIDESSNHRSSQIEDEDKQRKDRLYDTHFSSSLLNFPNGSAPLPPESPHARVLRADAPRRDLARRRHLPGRTLDARDQTHTG